MSKVVMNPYGPGRRPSSPGTISIIAMLSLAVVAITACADDEDILADEQDIDEGPQLASLYELSDDKLHPENGDYDPVTQAFYVGSLGRGNITRIDADGTESIFYEGTGEPERVTLGIRADVERRRLWVCSMLNEETEPGKVWVLDLDDASMLHRFDLTEVYEEASCNDVDVDAQGRAYVTDRQNPQIYRIDLDEESVEVWATDDLLAPELIGLNGVVVTPDEQALIVTKYFPPRLLRISMNDPSEVAEVELSGDPFQGRGLLSGADGIALDGEILYVAFSDTVMRLEFDDQWRQAQIDAKPAVNDGLAAIIVAQGLIYTVRGEVIAFALNQPPDLPFELRRIDPEVF